MAFCAKCGAQLQEGAAFCVSCGAPAGPPSGNSPASAMPGTGTMSSNVAGMLAYVLGFITGIVFLVIDPYKRDRFVRFHAFQSIFLSAAYILIAIAWGIVSELVFTVSMSGMWHLVYLGWIIIRLGFFLLWIFLLYKAYNNERFELPLIGPLAAKQAGQG